MKILLSGVLAATLLTPVVAWAEGDANAGERVFNRCKACHAVGDDARVKIGPPLNGIVDGAAGTYEDFRYSDALMERAAEGLIWDEEALTAFLTKPAEYLPGTAMSYAGLRREGDIADLIAYLRGFE